MNIEQIYTGCLAQGAYFIHSNGEAAVIDPLRETGPYLKRAEKMGVQIKYIFETHFHADFVSGHIDLAKKTGATIVYGPNATTKFDKYNATDGEEFDVGKIKIRALHTPGHTPESTTYLLIDENGKDHSIFTGDTLFIGDVGRPDLAQKATNLTKEDLAGWLYDSLRNKIMPLSDDVIVYPAHGAGSSCGKNMSTETFDTLGHQKETNYALRADMTREEFITEVTEGLLPPPQYFAKNAYLNKSGYSNIDQVMAQGVRPLSLEEFEVVINDEGILLLDVRSKEEFVEGFIPGSIFISLNTSFAPWVGALVPDINQKIVLITPVGKEEEAVRRLARVGYDNTVGYLEDGIDTWKSAKGPLQKINTISVNDFRKAYQEGVATNILDVRKPGEYTTSHIVEAITFPLDFINEHMSEISSEEQYYLHCQSGNRSTIASSILLKRGFKQLINVHGDFEDIKNAGFSLDGTCPSLVME